MKRNKATLRPPMAAVPFWGLRVTRLTPRNAFDLLHLDGKDLTGLTLTERKAALEGLLRRMSGPIRFSEYIDGGEAFFAEACTGYGFCSIVKRKGKLN